MKGLATAFLLFTATAAFAQGPDPRDSIILESKTVYPQSGTGGIVRLKVYITNKDSLTFINLALRESTMVGGAYMTLARPRTFAGVVNRLTTTLGASRVVNFGPYNSNSPDSFYLASGIDPYYPSLTIEPPNAARKALWELKFDSVFNYTGTIEFDTATVVRSTGITNTVPLDLPVNFLKSVVTVVPLKGDLNLDGEVSPADAVLELMCVHLGFIPTAGRGACELTCDGERTLADVMAILNAVFLAEPLAC